jgi:hypothetical protein
MSQFFKKLLGLILIITTVGIATCQSLVKADSKLLNSHYLSLIKPNQAQ